MVALELAPELAYIGSGTGPGIGAGTVPGIGAGRDEMSDNQRIKEMARYRSIWTQWVRVRTGHEKANSKLINCWRCLNITIRKWERM